MFKTEKVERIVELTLLTGFIKDDKPVSLMLIAPPESAKTSILRGFDCYQALETSDLSPKVITDKIVPRLRDYSIHHIILPDMVKILAHKTPTVNATIGFFNAMMEEGILRNMFFGQEFEFDKPRVCGILTSVTEDFFKQACRRWNEMGFITRFLIVSYKYSNETVSEIHKRIQENVSYNEIKELVGKSRRSYDRKFSIGMPDEISSYLSIQAQEIAKREHGYTYYTRVQGGNWKKFNINILGFRLHKQLRQLARAEALRRTIKKPEVTWPDIEELKQLLDFIRFPNNPKEL